MALSRRTGQRFQAAIWPGFVDAMTGLLLVLMFVLTIFLVIQAVLRETISGQESQLSSLTDQIASLADELGMAERQNTALTNRVGALESTLENRDSRLLEQQTFIAALTAERDRAEADLAAAEGRISDFEDRVTALLADRDAARDRIADLTATQEDLEAARSALLSEREALNLALASARDEIDAEAEAARLAAAQREAMEALVADLRAQTATTEGAVDQLSGRVDELTEALSAEEAARLAEAEAARALRARLETATAELTAMTLQLEARRQEAEDTLTLLAAARAAGDELNTLLETALAGRAEVTATNADLRAELAALLAAQARSEARAAEAMSEAEAQAALLSAARDTLAGQEVQTEAAQREAEVLNQQLTALRQQLLSLQETLDAAAASDADAQVQIDNLGARLNAALARVATEARRAQQAEAETLRLEAERAARLEAENRDLERYRSEFFGQLRALLADRDGVRIEGDRFVFSSEVLFAPGEAELSAAGRRGIATVAGILRDIADEIPESIDWVIRVDGHTDDIPILPGAKFADNWELSQARALSVVRFLIDTQGIPPSRLAANGFGEFQPVNPAKTVAARAQNRRIELKLTEK
ncbi:peptidoglycan -binding protein [Roseivivax sp. CAU 1753]